MKKVSTYLLISAMTLGLVNPVFAQENTTVEEGVATEEVTDTIADETVDATEETVSDGLEEVVNEAPAQYVISDSSTRDFVFNNEVVTPQPWDQVIDAAAATEAEDGLKDLNIEWGRLNTDLYSIDGVLYEAGTPVFRVVNHDTQNTTDFAIFGSITYPGVETYGHVAAQYVDSEGFTYVEDAGAEDLDVFTQAEAFKSTTLENVAERLEPNTEEVAPALTAQALFTENAEGVYELAPTAEEETTDEGEETTVEGETTTAEGETTTAEGETTTAEGETTTAEGETTTAEGETTTAEGETTTAEGETTTAEGETTTAAATEEKTYEIAEGDTLNKIAEEFGITVEELKAFNNMTDDNIFAGQTIKIPVKGASESTTVEGETTTAQAETTTLAVSQETSVIAQQTTKDGKALPKTGEKSANILIAGALILAGLGVALITFNKNKEKNN